MKTIAANVFAWCENSNTSLLQAPLKDVRPPCLKRYTPDPDGFSMVPVPTQHGERSTQRSTLSLSTGEMCLGTILGAGALIAIIVYVIQYKLY